VFGPKTGHPRCPVEFGATDRLWHVSKTVDASARGLRDLLVAYLRTQIDQLRAREPGARIDSPDAVHRMRVAARRLRSGLATFRPLFAGKQAQHCRDELRWLGTVLGPVRDVEVMRARLHETASVLPADVDLAEVLADLDHELAERHSRAHDGLIAALNGPRYADLLADLAAFVSQPPWVDGDAKAATRHTLQGLVGRACARVDRAATAAEGAPDVGGQELHEVRKAAKRARYAAEVAGPAAGPPAIALAHGMEDLQELLGRHQDSLMARAFLEDLADRMPEREGFALGLLTGVEHASDESVLAAYGVALAAAATEEVRGWTREVEGTPDVM